MKTAAEALRRIAEQGVAFISRGDKSGTNATDTMRFVNWLTDPEKGQVVIRGFGKEKYGAPLLFPNSEDWQKTKGK
ncbi:MAG: hypothetical protein RBR01_03250 [Desulfobacterales bacterium]|jgi:tungstate transport system substrate-binding protein|nr:hypothetical protein [Desulfobacterales bacterium]MDY0377431.1 hypothetical protein [Desulfobacterales bacterium]